MSAVRLDQHFDCIAEGLVTHGWLVIDGFLAPALTRALRDECRRPADHGAWHAGAVGAGHTRQAHGETRGDEICWMPQPACSPAQRRFQAIFERMRLQLNRTLQLGLFEFESHFARYPVGARYVRHVDQFRSDTRRQLSCVLYLNEDWQGDDGGELRLYLEGGAPAFADVLPRAGCLLVFLSARFAHEVLPAKRERLSIAGWFTRRSSDQRR